MYRIRSRGLGAAPPTSFAECWRPVHEWSEPCHRHTTRAYSLNKYRSCSVPKDTLVEITHLKGLEPSAGPPQTTHDSVDLNIAVRSLRWKRRMYPGPTMTHSKLDVKPNPNHPYIRVMPYLSCVKWVLSRAHGTDICDGSRRHYCNHAIQRRKLNRQLGLVY